MTTAGYAPDGAGGGSGAATSAVNAGTAALATHGRIYGQSAHLPKDPPRSTNTAEGEGDDVGGGGGGSARKGGGREHKNHSAN